MKTSGDKRGEIMPFRKKQEALDLIEGDMTDLRLTATSRMQDLA